MLATIFYIAVGIIIFMSVRNLFKCWREDLGYDDFLSCLDDPDLDDPEN